MATARMFNKFMKHSIFFPNFDIFTKCVKTYIKIITKTKQCICIYACVCVCMYINLKSEEDTQCWPLISTFVQAHTPYISTYAQTYTCKYA